MRRGELYLLWLGVAAAWRRRACLCFLACARVLAAGGGRWRAVLRYH